MASDEDSQERPSGLLGAVTADGEIWPALTAQKLAVFAGITHMLLLAAGALTQFAITPAQAATLNALGSATNASALLISGTAAAFFAILSGRHSRQRPRRATVSRLDVATPGDVERDWSELMARTSHDLRTPLNAVIGFTDVMHRELLGPIGHERYREYIGHIRDASLDLMKSTEDTLAITAMVTDPQRQIASNSDLASLLGAARESVLPLAQCTDDTLQQPKAAHRVSS